MTSFTATGMPVITTVTMTSSTTIMVMVPVMVKMVMMIVYPPRRSPAVALQ